MSILAVIILLLLYLGLAVSPVVTALSKLVRTRTGGLLLLVLLLLPYLLASLPRPDMLDLAIMVAYIFGPGLLLLYRPRTHPPLDWLDILAVLALWFPIEWDWLPDLSVTLIPGLSLPVPLLTGICLGFVLFLVIRPLDGMGYTFRLGRSDVWAAVQAYLAFAVIGLPLGVIMGFIQFQMAEINVTAWLLRLLAIYLFNALPEEMLFRGIIQNLTEQRFGRTWLTLGGAALLFGFSHINNVTDFHSPPNWPYVLMATLAGLAYGWVWRKSGKITAAALTHTLVNFTWAILFGS